jgi:hypothetical protein
MGCLSFCFLRVLGVALFFLMAPSLHLSSVHGDIPRSIALMLGLVDC